MNGFIPENPDKYLENVAAALDSVAAVPDEVLSDVVSRDGTCLRLCRARLDRNSNDLVVGAHGGIVAGLSSGRWNVVDRANANYQLLHFRRDDGNRLVRDLEGTQP